MRSPLPPRKAAFAPCYLRFRAQAALLSICAGSACFYTAPCLGDVSLPDLISNHAVLKQSAETPIWGTADPGEQVSVTLNGHTASTQADADGRWKLHLNLEKSAGGPFEMLVQGRNAINIKDIMVGDVWVASGQSNMEWPLEKTLQAEEEIANSANNLIREFSVEKNSSLTPATEAKGRWKVATPANSGKFSAVGYYFAKRVSAETGRAVGIINSTWGGTDIEAWMSEETSDSFPSVGEERRRQWAQSEEYPQENAAFIESMNKWLQDHNREDLAPADPAVFANRDVDTSSWTKLRLSEEVSAPDLPRTGVIWLRRSVTLPAGDQTATIITPMDGFYSIYWDGQLINHVGVGDFTGMGAVVRTPIPAEAGNAPHTLAIRIFQPDRPAAFTGPVALRRAPRTIALDDEWLAKIERKFPDPDPETPAPKAPQEPPLPKKRISSLFNGMISPLLHYGIDGVIWYQGENNANRPAALSAEAPYGPLFAALIRDWRARWRQGDFPFLYCQLASFKEKTADPGASSKWAQLREAQSSTLKLPSTGQAVLIDLGEADDIHPRRKREVGFRLADIALTKHHGLEKPFSGPVFERVEFNGAKAILSFRHLGGGLVAETVPETHPLNSSEQSSAPLVRNSPDSELEGFAIRGEDGQWHWAEASIEGDQVFVWSSKVSKPVAVRYGWADNPTANLFNDAGLPASPFCTDQTEK